jgi:hypothetical protein
MKNIFRILAIVVALSASYAFTNSDISEYELKETTTSISDYCDGWEEGYCEGWKDVKGQMALCPLTPLCPLAKFECSDGFRCGYNRGFKAGIKAARK